MSGQQLTRAVANVARLLACYDPRLDDEKEEIARRLRYSSKHLDNLLRDIRQNARELWAQHIRDIRALKLASVVVSSKRSIEDASTVDDLERMGLPWARYLYSYRRILSNTGKRVYSYLAPLNLLDELVSDVERYFDDGKVDVGFVIPVKYDCDHTEVSERLNDELIKKAEHDIKQPPPRMNPNLLDIILYARLDENPLVTIRDMQDITSILEERLGSAPPLRLRKRKLRPEYVKLSRMKLLGRALIIRATWPEGQLAPLYVSVSRSCATRLYALSLALWAAPSVFVGSETAATILTVPDNKVHLVEEELGDCIVDSGYITAGFGTVIPVEMFSPKRGWSTEKQPLEQLLLGLGLAEVRRQNRGED